MDLSMSEIITWLEKFLKMEGSQQSYSSGKKISNVEVIKHIVLIEFYAFVIKICPRGLRLRSDNFPCQQYALPQPCEKASNMED